MPKYRERDYGEGTIKKRLTPAGRTVYRGRVMVNGKRTSVTRDSYQACADEIDRLRDLDGEVVLAPAPKLGAWMREWIDVHAPERDPKTVVLRERALDKLKPLAGYELDRITTPLIEKRFRELASSGLSRGTIKNVRTPLALALDDAIRLEQGITVNYARLARIPDSAKKAREGRTLSTEQAGALLAVADRDPYEIAVVLMLWLGLRPGEATGLPWSAIDLDTGTIDIVQMAHRDGTGLFCGFTTPKAKSDRRIALPPEVVAALHRQHTRQATWKLRAGPQWRSDLDLVASTRLGTAITLANLRRSVAKLATLAEIPGHLTPYDLRHTAASLLVESGMPLEEVSDLLGHRTTKQLIETYRHRSKRVVDGRAKMREVFAS